MESESAPQGPVLGGGSGFEGANTTGSQQIRLIAFPVFESPTGYHLSLSAAWELSPASAVA